MALLNGKQILDGSVVGGKIADAPNGVATAKINDDAVDETKLDLSKTYDFKTGGGDVKVALAPATDDSAISKAYADALLEGLNVKAACRVATVAALPAYTAAGSGIGKTITINAVGVLTIDGVATVLGDRVLVKDEAAAHVDHGIYEVTTEGTVAVAAILTRATDFDGNPSGEVEDGDYTFIGEGTTNSDNGFVLITNDPITVDTTPLEFSQFSGAGQITARDGLTKTGDILDVTPVAAGGLEIAGGAGSNGDLQVKVDVTGGANLAKVINTSANGVAVGIDDDTVKEGASNRLKAATRTKGDQNLGVSTTASDEDTTGVTISKTPAGDRMVSVKVNGVEYTVGDGVKTTACYFSADGGTTARAMGAIVSGDTLYWVGSVAGFELAAADDKLSLGYDTAA